MKQNTKRFLTAIAAALMVTASFTACGCESKSKKASATADETTSVIKDDEPEFTTIALDETEQAIADQGLTVNDKGEVVDANGSKVETTEEGNVKVTTADGQTVEVNVDKVKQTTKKTTENSKAEAQASAQANAPQPSNTNNTTSKSTNSGANSGGSASNQSSQSTQKQSSSAQSSQTTPKQTSSNSSKQQSSAQQSSSSGGSKQQSSGGNTQKSDSGKTSPVQPTTASDPHAGKTWHEAVYKTVEHPAETKQVKIVDQEAYSYEEPVYEWRIIAKCKDCGIDLAQLTGEERDAHAEYHVLYEDGDGGWYTAQEEVQVGTRTVNVPEQSHMGTVVVKEAWEEKVLVREAGWY